MKVYVINFKPVISLSDQWFVWNVYSSKKNAIQVLETLRDDSDNIYYLSEYDVIDY